MLLFCFLTFDIQVSSQRGGEPSCKAPVKAVFLLQPVLSRSLPPSTRVYFVVELCWSEESKLFWGGKAVLEL